jgi:peptidoglycan L-alanyl-D-glutamate endopeptidase CwlK
MTDFVLSRRSLRRLKGVKKPLVMCVKRAIELTNIDFMVIEGVRTVAEQRKRYASGSSHTMNSRHLTGHAVDLGPLINGKIPWDNIEVFREVSYAMLAASYELEIDIQWGGNWPILRDGPHFQLTWESYPV